MTVDKTDVDHGFSGLMRNLNFESDVLKPIDENFEALDFAQLSSTKDEIEKQLSLLFNILRNEYNADMSTSLLTEDQFPRDDIDVVSIRLIRVKIIRLRNDHTRVLSLLQQKLETALARGDEDQSESIRTSRNFIQRSAPFAVVKEVKEGSPAERSGLREHDRLVKFGSVHRGNHSNLARLAVEVRDNEEKTINVLIIRRDEDISLELRPTNRWNGQGLLGCHILPL